MIQTPVPYLDTMFAEDTDVLSHGDATIAVGICLVKQLFDGFVVPPILETLANHEGRHCSSLSDW